MGDSRSPLRYVGNDGKNGYVENDGEGDFKGMTEKMVSSGMTGKNGFEGNDGKHPFVVLTA